MVNRYTKYEANIEYCRRYCEEIGIKLEYINESPVSLGAKPYYNLLLDDRAGLGEAIKLLRDILE